MSKVTEKLHSNKPISVTFAYTDTLTNQTGEDMGSTMKPKMIYWITEWLSNKYNLVRPTQKEQLSLMMLNLQKMKTLTVKSLWPWNYMVGNMWEKQSLNESPNGVWGALIQNIKIKTTCVSRSLD